MPSLFRLDASIRNEGSVTRALADGLQDAFVSGLGDVSITRRDIGLTPLPSTAWAGAVFGPYVPADHRTKDQQDAMALAIELANELKSADAFLFAVPLYNFGVSQHFKTWVDLVMTQPEFLTGDIAIKGRPAQLITARGGGYAPGTPRHGWDHSTAWYKRILEDVWMLDLQVIECELTLADVTPAMEQLRPMAAENLANAHALTKDHGQLLAHKLGG